MKKIPKAVREQFEDCAYTHYKNVRLSLALNGRKLTAELSRDAYLKRDASGAYVNSATSVLWSGWMLCLDALAPMLEAADLWRQWVDVQDRIAAELPKGYTVGWTLDAHNPNVEGSGLVALQLVRDVNDVEQEFIEFPDPADLNSPGLFTRLADQALATAKADHARRLN